MNTVQLTQISSTSLGRAQRVFFPQILLRLEMQSRLPKEAHKKQHFPCRGEAESTNPHGEGELCDTAGARDAEPLRSAALAPMGRAGYGERDPAAA